MQVQLKPELAKFVEDQVNAGKFSTPAEVVEAGLARLILDPEPDSLDSTDVTDIRASLEEMRRGDVIDWKEHSAALRKKYLGQ
jgi:Arc/MetJ-type ribon-helix-helix transcriptional regulator